MSQEIKGTFRGTLNSNGSITDATIAPEIAAAAAPPTVQVLRPPKLEHLLEQISSGTVDADAGKILRLRGISGSRYYGSEINQIQRDPNNDTPKPHGTDGNWSGA